MKKNGMYRPKNTMNPPMEKRVKGGSLHAFRSKSLRFIGGEIRRFITVKEKRRVLSAMNAIMRVAQAKPSLGCNSRKTAGYTIPPIATTSEKVRKRRWILTDTAAGCSQASGQRAPPAKVHCYNCHAGNEETPATKAYTNALRQEHLIVFCRNASNSHPKYNHKCTSANQGLEITHIEYGSSEDTDVEEEEALGGSYP